MNTKALQEALQEVLAQIEHSGVITDSSYQPGDPGGQHYYEIEAATLDNLVSLVKSITKAPQEALQEVLAQIEHSGVLTDSSYQPGDPGGQHYYEIEAATLDNLVKSIH